MLSLFTLEQGKLRAIAKGARKPRSRKAGHLEPFMRTSLLLERGLNTPAFLRRVRKGPVEAENY